MKLINELQYYYYILLQSSIIHNITLSCVAGRFESLPLSASTLLTGSAVSAFSAYSEPEREYRNENSKNNSIHSTLVTLQHAIDRLVGQLRLQSRLSTCRDSHRLSQTSVSFRNSLDPVHHMYTLGGSCCLHAFAAPWYQSHIDGHADPDTPSRRVWIVAPYV